MDNQLEINKQELTPEEENQRTRDRRVFIPPADIYETPSEIVVVADVPGASEESINITLEKNTLTIRAFVEPEIPAEQTLAYSEYAVGDYERSFVLPNLVNRDGIEAVLREGVLYLHLPKAAEAQPRRISVKAG